MSEAAEAPKKKKSPLPVVLALVLVLGGGGFFMTQGKSAPKEDKSVIKLAKEETPLEEEFLVNMADRNTYLRAKITLRFAENFEAHKLEENKGAIEDAIVRVLKTTRPEETVTDQQMFTLKKRIAESINHVLGEGEGGEESGKVTQIRRKVDETELPPDWASNQGPVLQVFFNSFAIQ